MELRRPSTPGGGLQSYSRFDRGVAAAWHEKVPLADRELDDLDPSLEMRPVMSSHSKSNWIGIPALTSGVLAVDRIGAGSHPMKLERIYPQNIVTMIYGDRDNQIQLW